MTWENLPTNYTDAIWSGLRKYTQINNDDGTVSFEDMTEYTQKENSFFGATDANQMNAAMNELAANIESVAQNAAAATIAATTAAESASEAANSATTAAESASEAANSATTVTESVNEAANSAADALNSADIAGLHATNASEYAAEIKNLLYNGAGAHNSLYRGKHLGYKVTTEQYNAIAQGTFDDMYIGDHWFINGVNWRIAAFDYYYYVPGCTQHHVTIVPDKNLYDAQMNESNTTAGGYSGSKMYTTNLADAKTTINNAFGSEHIFSHYQLLTKTVTNGKPSATYPYYNSIDLMTEQNVYGNRIFGAGNDGSTVPTLETIDKSQFPLFACNPCMISNDQIYWLRDVVSAANFAAASKGIAYAVGASAEAGVRPAFSISASQSPMIYGISRTITSTSPVWARTDGSVGKVAVASVGTTANFNDFDYFYPWSDITRETLSTGDVMVKIPRFWYRRYRSGNEEHIEIANQLINGFSVHPAFYFNNRQYEYIYVGAYKTSSDNQSVSGASPLVNQTRATARTNAKAKGTGWGIIDWRALSAIQMLMLVEFANNNVQSVIGQGYCNDSSGSLTTGTCDTVGGLTGRPAGTDGKVDVVWRGIEGFWGNVWEWVDGINWYDGSYYLGYDPNEYQDDTTGNVTLSFTGATNWSSSYITQEGLDTTNPCVILPSAASKGSATTYECDYAYSSTKYRVFCHGGYHNAKTGAGLFASSFQCTSSDTLAIVGSRLHYVPS